MDKNVSKTIATMRALAIDAINEAKQGHIGMAIDAAPITYALYGETMRLAKDDPKWIDRDRFAMSAGHGSMALYTIAHLLGWLTMDDIKKHKQLHSRTPSHPEIDVTPFVDANTGPLGQGLAMAVGMALSEKYLAQKFNKPDFPVFSHHVFALIGDACVQEGVGQEALQLAGTWKLDNLIVIQDWNNMQIDSASEAVNGYDAIKWVQALGFNTIDLPGSDPAAIVEAIKKAKASVGKPTFIRVKTTIAEGTKVAGTPAGHNGVLSPEETVAFKKAMGLTDAVFAADKDVYDFCQSKWLAREEAYQSWKKLLANYAQKFPEEHKLLQSLVAKTAKHDVSGVTFKEKDVATRNYVGAIIKALEADPFIVGGSADLASATKVAFAAPLLKGGKNIQYGVREFAMTAINNGINLHCGLRTVDATFLTFADYAKNAYRVGAIMQLPAIHVLTHDSYQVGGDGPTHQPVEQLAMLRAMPGSLVIRPCDGEEMKQAFQLALDTKDKQSFIIACRQPIPSYGIAASPSDLSGYVVTKGEKAGKPNVILLASGSEVGLAVEVSKKLAAKGLSAAVASVPAIQLLLADETKVKSLGIPGTPTYAIEATSDTSWWRLSKWASKFDSFGAEGYGYSAPGDDVYEEKGFVPELIAAKVESFLKA